MAIVKRNCAYCGLPPEDHDIDRFTGEPEKCPNRASAYSTVDMPLQMTSSRSYAIDDQPMPIANSQPACWDLVIADIKERDAHGLATYGTRLQPFNGRNAAKDKYQELLDAVVYSKQEQIERDRAMSLLGNLLSSNRLVYADRTIVEEVVSILKGEFKS
jgi:hypothetical protein